jgi:hypothetical protein
MRSGNSSIKRAAPPAWNQYDLTSRAHPPAPFRFPPVCVHLHEHFERAGNTVSLDQLAGAMKSVWELGEFLFAGTLTQLPNPSPKHQVMDDESERNWCLLGAESFRDRCLT